MKSFFIFWIIVTILLTFMCVGLTGCAHISKDGRTLYGWGKVKRDAEGKVLEIESSPPIQLPQVKFD